MKDHLVKATADGVRIYAAVTTDLVNEAIRRHDCYPVAAAALARRQPQEQGSADGEV